MEKQEILSKFRSFKTTLYYPYSRAYFTEEVDLLLRDGDYIMQMIKIKSKEIKQYSEFSNYNFKLNSEKIEEEDFVILLTIRHFDMYIEFLLTDKGKTIKSNLKNKLFGVNEENKLVEFNEYIFIKGKLQSSEHIFKKDDYKAYVDFRKPIIGGWKQGNLKIYFKNNNQLVFIKDESVLLGKYYFLYNFVKFYFENSEDHKIPESLYYEFSFTDSNLLELTNESYGHFYIFNKITTS